MKNPISIQIQLSDDGTKKVSILADNAPAEEVAVINNTGTSLPSTGGMGTTIFYIAGAFLVLISGVVLIAKKRTDSK